MVAPRASLVKVPRGGAVSRVTPAFQVVSVVATPFNSRARAASPTDWAHSGQAGTSKAASIASALAASRIAGINSLRVRSTLG